MCNPRDRAGEMPASSTSPYSWKNVTVTLLLLEQALSPTVFPWHLVISSCEAFPGESTILPNKKYFPSKSFQQNSTYMSKALLSWSHTWPCGYVPSPAGTIVDAPSNRAYDSGTELTVKVFGSQGETLSRRGVPQAAEGGTLLVYYISYQEILCFILSFCRNEVG